MKRLFMLLSGLLPLTLIAQLQSPVIDLVQVASGFNRPVDIAHANDDRLFVVEQDGTIRIINGGRYSFANAFPQY